MIKVKIEISYVYDLIILCTPYNLQPVTCNASGNLLVLPHFRKMRTVL